jgi:hypothetical protein
MPRESGESGNHCPSNSGEAVHQTNSGRYSIPRFRDEIRYWMRQNFGFPKDAPIVVKEVPLREARVSADRNRDPRGVQERAAAPVQGAASDRRDYVRSRLRSDREPDAVLLRGLPPSPQAGEGTGPDPCHARLQLPLPSPRCCRCGRGKAPGRAYRRQHDIAGRVNAAVNGERSPVPRGAPG